MNPIEQIWPELRTQGFRNETFAALEKVVDRLCEVIGNLTKKTVISIAGYDWIYAVLIEIRSGPEFWHRGPGCMVHYNVKIGKNCKILLNAMIGSKFKAIPHNSAATLKMNLQPPLPAKILIYIR